MGVSFQELILLLMIGLIVLGPERLPRVANQLGNWLGQARRMTRVMKRQLEDELNLDRQYDMLPPARTRHSTPGSQVSPTGTASTAGGGETASAAPAPAAGDEKGDTWSPAHGADDVGTGVGDAPKADTEDAEAANAGNDDETARSEKKASA